MNVGKNNQIEFTMAEDPPQTRAATRTGWGLPAPQNSQHPWLLKNRHEELKKVIDEVTESTRTLGLSNNYSFDGIWAPSVPEPEKVFTKADYAAIRKDFERNGYNDMSWPIQDWPDEKSLSPLTKSHCEQQSAELYQGQQPAESLYEQNSAESTPEADDQCKTWSQTLKSEKLWTMEESVVETEIKKRKNKFVVFEHCVFCKKNGEPEEVYSNHVCKDATGKKVLCPKLSQYTCPACGATGEDAHTRQYCPRKKITSMVDVINKSSTQSPKNTDRLNS